MTVDEAIGVCASYAGPECADDITEVATLLKNLADVANEFCDRVERGEVRSTYTYNRFKEILGR